MTARIEHDLADGDGQVGRSVGCVKSADSATHSRREFANLERLDDVIVEWLGCYKGGFYARLTLLIQSPPSILYRKHELNRSWH